MGVMEIKEGFRRGTQYRLGHRTLTIGRAPGNIIQLIDDTVSRRHAIVAWEEGACRIADLHSHNGILVNGEDVHERMLIDYDTVVIGSTSLQLLPEDQLRVDATFERKVMDQGIVGGTTMKTGSIDGSAAGNEATIMEMLHDLNLAAARGQSGEALWKRATLGARMTVGPDRFVLFDMPDGRPNARHRAHRPGLNPVFVNHKPHKESLLEAMKERRAVLRIDLGEDVGQRSAIAVPVQEGERLTGVLYADSFTLNFNESQLDVLLMIAFTLRASLS